MNPSENIQSQAQSHFSTANLSSILMYMYLSLEGDHLHIGIWCSQHQFVKWHPPGNYYRVWTTFLCS